MLSSHKEYFLIEDKCYIVIIYLWTLMAVCGAINNDIDKFTITVMATIGIIA